MQIGSRLISGAYRATYRHKRLNIITVLAHRAAFMAIPVALVLRGTSEDLPLICAEYI